MLLEKSTFKLNPNIVAWKDSPLFIASQAIKVKANALGLAFTGAATSGVTPLTVGTSSGYQQMFAQCIIFYSAQTGAHEVHGEILRKYVLLPLKRLDLGFPVTDEMGTPDGKGRYNHFYNDASIYWHPTTGPMAVQGAVRDYWASEGWERGPLGYPVRDMFVPESGETAGDFQNGVVWIGPSGYAAPKTATLPAQQLLDLIWHQFDTLVHQSPDNVGLHPDKSFDGVTDTGYGFPESWNRGFKVTINGFHDSGALLPDIDWSAHMAIVISLGYGLATNQQSQTVETYTIGATIDDISVTDSGVLTTFSDAVASKVQDAIQSASDSGVDFGFDIPIDAPVLSLKMMLDGTLTFFLSPTLAGGFTQAVIQERINAM
jgi:hypothetical protein